MATAFNTQGATPGYTPLPKNAFGTTPSTPFSSGMNVFSSQMGQSTSPFAKALSSVAVPPSPTPSTPVKKTTMTDTAGNTHTTEYHAPLAPASSPTSVPSSTPAAPTPPQNPAPQPPTFPGLIGSLAQSSQQGSPTAPGYISQTAQAGQGNEAIGKSAAQIAADYGKQIAQVGQQGAMGEAGQLTTGTSPVAEGNAAVTQQTTAARQQALATGEEAALLGTGQQLTGQNQEANAFNSAAGQANTGQSNLQSGLNNAASLAQPQLGQIGQVPFSPTTGSQGSVLGSTQPGGVQAAGNLLGQFQGAQAQGAAPGQAAASNIQTSGTTPTNTAATGYAGAVQNYNNASTAYSTASAQSQNLQQTMTTTGINQNPQFVNQKINQLQNQLGSTNYPAFITALNETKQAYTSLLSSVGASTPTVNGQQATDIFNENSTPNQINAAIDALNQAAYAKLQPLYQQIGTYQGKLNGNGNSNANSSLYSF